MLKGKKNKNEMSNQSCVSTAEEAEKGACELMV